MGTTTRVAWDVLQAGRAQFCESQVGASAPRSDLPHPTNNTHFTDAENSHEAHRDARPRTDPFHVKAPASKPNRIPRARSASGCIRKAHNLAAMLCPSQGQGTNASPGASPQITTNTCIYYTTEEVAPYPEAPAEIKRASTVLALVHQRRGQGGGGCAEGTKRIRGTPGSRDREAVLGQRHSTGHGFLSSATTHHGLSTE